MKILLHACCAWCSVYPLKRLKELGFEVYFFWYNPNIHPYLEYKKRKEAFLKFLKINRDKVSGIFIKDEYDIKKFFKDVNGICKNCFDLRLEELFLLAEDLNFEYVSTTLFFSPHQKHEVLKNVALNLSKEFNINLFYEDWRIFFKEATNEYRKLNLYMQEYCGCIYSEMDRFLGRRGKNNV